MLVYNFIEKYVQTKRAKEQFIAFDVGATSVKMAQIDVSGNTRKLVKLGVESGLKNLVNNNGIAKPEKVIEVIQKLIADNEVEATKATIAIPSSCAFTKKITMPAQDLASLENNIQFEAPNYIPHNLSAVHFDYQIINVKEDSTMDIMLVAVKNEIVQSSVDVIISSGLEPAIVDIDCFAIENSLEHCHPESHDKVTALVDIGGRFSAVSIIQNGVSVFTGDVSTGGKVYTESLCEAFDVEPEVADEIKKGNLPEGVDADAVSSKIDETTSKVVDDLNRQIKFFWNAVDSEGDIELILVTGGVAQTPGLVDELREKSGVDVHVLNPLGGIDSNGTVDDEVAQELAPYVAVSVGLATRRFADKVHAKESN